MDKYDQICALLAEKHSAFVQYEKETQALFLGRSEELEGHMDNRRALIEQIDGLDKEIGGLCGDDKPALDAAWNRCPRDGLSTGLAKIFDAAQEIFAVANRVRNAEIQAVGRIENERDRLDRKIRELNRSVEAQAAKYLSVTASMASRPYQSSRPSLGNA